MCARESERENEEAMNHGKWRCSLSTKSILQTSAGCTSSSTSSTCSIKESHTLIIFIYFFLFLFLLKEEKLNSKEQNKLVAGSDILREVDSIRLSRAISGNDR